MKKKIFLFPLITFSIILFIFFYLLLIERNPSEIPSNLIDKDIPKFKSESLIKSGEYISQENFKNKITLVNFFASWCKPCRDEHKYIKLLANNENIQIIGINYKDNPKKAKAWLAEVGNPYLYIGTDKKGNFAIDWGVYGIPETFIVNSKSIIKYRHVGPITKKIYKKINSIISETR
jgi:cytochrome c biogenesis protein CcmG/thiol:disulfide interchange protein DsbE